MYQQVYEAAIPYRMPWNTVRWPPDGIPNGIGLGSLYNPWLVTPPRIYGETLFIGEGTSTLLTALFTRDEATATSQKVVSMLFWMSMVYWPGWEIRLYRFDGATGAFIDYRTIPWGAVYVAWTRSIQQGFDGSIWRSDALGRLVELSPDLLHELQEIEVSTRFPGRITADYPCVDKQRDLIILQGESGRSKIQVYTLSTGAWIRDINVSDDVARIFPEDDTRVYVQGEHGLLNVVNYETGEIYSTTKAPKPIGAVATIYSWDTWYKRLMVGAALPDATDGASASIIAGYRLVPLMVGLTTPIPLKAPRKGRIIPVVTRCIGDVGEPIGTRPITAQATGQATVSTFPALTDGNGYAQFQVTCSDAGSADILVSTEL